MWTRSGMVGLAAVLAIWLAAQSSATTGVASHGAFGSKDNYLILTEY